MPRYYSQEQDKEVSFKILHIDSYTRLPKGGQKINETKGLIVGFV